MIFGNTLRETLICSIFPNLLRKIPYIIIFKYTCSCYHFRNNFVNISGKYHFLNKIGFEIIFKMKVVKNYFLMESFIVNKEIHKKNSK